VASASGRDERPCPLLRRILVENVLCGAFFLVASFLPTRIDCNTHSSSRFPFLHGMLVLHLVDCAATGVLVVTQHLVMLRKAIHQPGDELTYKLSVRPLPTADSKLARQ
jgi:hypothetical protein